MSSNELQAYLPSGLTLYAVLINSTGQIWNTAGTPAFEAYNGGNWTDYDIALTEAGAGIYLGDMPAAAAGAYSYAVYEQAGEDPDETDTIKGSGYLEWDGSAVIAAFDPAGDIIEGSMTYQKAMMVLVAALAGKASGGGTATVTFRNLADDTDRITMTVDANGNRSAVKLTLT